MPEFFQPINITGPTSTATNFNPLTAFAQAFIGAPSGDLFGVQGLFGKPNVYDPVGQNFQGVDAMRQALGPEANNLTGLNALFNAYSNWSSRQAAYDPRSAKGFDVGSSLPFAIYDPYSTPFTTQEGAIPRGTESGISGAPAYNTYANDPNYRAITNYMSNLMTYPTKGGLAGGTGFVVGTPGSPGSSQGNPWSVSKHGLPPIGRPMWFENKGYGIAEPASTGNASDFLVGRPGFSGATPSVKFTPKEFPKPPEPVSPQYTDAQMQELNRLLQEFSISQQAQKPPMETLFQTPQEEPVLSPIVPSPIQENKNEQVQEPLPEQIAPQQEPNVQPIPQTPSEPEPIIPTPSLPIPEEPQAPVTQEPVVSMPEPEPIQQPQAPFDELFSPVQPAPETPITPPVQEPVPISESPSIPETPSFPVTQGPIIPMPQTPTLEELFPVPIVDEVPASVETPQAQPVPTEIPNDSITIGDTFPPEIPPIMNQPNQIQFPKEQGFEDLFKPSEPKEENKDFPDLPDQQEQPQFQDFQFADFPQQDFPSGVGQSAGFGDNSAYGGQQFSPIMPGLSSESTQAFSQEGAGMMGDQQQQPYQPLTMNDLWRNFLRF